MKRPILLLIVVGLAASVCLAQPTLYVSPDVPTDADPGNPPPTYLPWDVIEHRHLGAIPYTLALTVPGDPAIDALHKMDRPDNWLFSVEAPNFLAGLLASVAEPRDVVRIDGGMPSLFFDGSCVAGAVPLESAIDAIYLEGGDDGNLIVSFDVPTTIGISTFQPSELVRYVRMVGPPCGWTLAGSVIDFASIGTYFPAGVNVIGADRAAGDWILALDIPADLGPPFGPTRTPGQIVSTDGTTWNHNFDDLQAEGVPGWPINSLVDALSCQANPGRIESPVVQILLDKNLPQVTIVCPAGCSSGGEAYGVYEGTIASIRTGVYDHQAILCSEVCPGNIAFVPAGANASNYYLVVPHNYKEEGSYCTDSAGNQRPQAAVIADRCVAYQNLEPCP